MADPLSLSIRIVAGTARKVARAVHEEDPAELGPVGLGLGTRRRLDAPSSPSGRRREGLGHVALHRASAPQAGPGTGVEVSVQRPHACSVWGA
jgi:hypothetical protein